jgi:hypothetical protein
MRERLTYARTRSQQAGRAEAIAATHAALSDVEWNNLYQSGRNTPLEDALTEAHTAD